MGDSLWYPSVEDVLTIHEDIVAEYPDTPSGVRDQGDVEFALTYIEEGHLGAPPEPIHEKAYHLLRLLAANHPFADANKRTALNTVAVFYFLNGYRFAYDGEIRAILYTDEPGLRRYGGSRIVFASRLSERLLRACANASISESGH